LPHPLRNQPWRLPPLTPARYRFGPFLLRLDQRVLYRDGQVVPLTPRPLDMLVVLLEHAGEIVSRETLLERVWQDAFVEEANLRKNISLLRTTLGPQLGEEQFIRTVPKRGYLLAVPVTVEYDETDSPVISPHASPADGAAAAPSPAILATREAPWPWIVSAAVLIVFAAGGLVLALHHRNQAMAEDSTPGRSVAVTAFRNLGGQPEKAWMGVAIQETLAADLATGGGLQVVDGQRATQAERDLGLTDGTALDDAALGRIGKRLQTAMVLVGSYLPVGDRVRIDVQLRSVRNGSVIAEYSDTTAEADVLDVLATTSARLRGALALTPTPISPGSLSAEQAYAEGLRLSREDNEPVQARDMLIRAVGANPASPLAHEALAAAWKRLGYDAEARAEAQAALDRSDALPEPARLSLQGTSYALLGEYPQAIDTLKRLATADPGDPEPEVRLAHVYLEANELANASTLLQTLRSRSTSPQAGHQAGLPADPRVPLYQALAADRTGDRKAELLYAGEAADSARAVGARSVEAAALDLGASAWDLLGNLSKSLDDLHRAEGIFTQLEDSGGLAEALMTEGGILTEQGLPQAEPLLQRAAAIADTLGDHNVSGRALVGLGNLHLAEAKPQAAQTDYLQALDVAQRYHLRPLELIVAANLAIPAMTIGNMADAERYSNQALAIATEDHSPAIAAHASDTLAYVERYTGKLTAAGDHLDQALAYAKPLGDASDTNAILEHKAMLLMDKGDLAGARRTFASVDMQALTPSNRPAVQLDDSQLALEEGKFAEAGKAMTALAAQTKDNDLGASAVVICGQAALQAGRLDEAKIDVQRAAALAATVPADQDVARDIELLRARINIEAGSTAEAPLLAQLLLQAESAGHYSQAMRIKLAQAELQARKRDFVRARELLLTLRSQANQSGSGLIVQHANEQLAAL
jgi:DNA-binding winged helix-turn-helix (wHTH) protein/tetratricopeptide (TPR) repeat protein/TolB-like protein